jgi:hypothetical protein
MYMNTRQKTEYEVYVLELAEMHGGVDKAIPVGVFTSLDELKNYYQEQIAEESYIDEIDGHKWHKVFKKGSRLEWFNGADTLEPQTYQQCSFGGVNTQWVTEYPTRESISYHLIFNGN